tara:strand:+ start:213 stop:575 length:363 start_codon:yes stop_codon:yes gene_type:complete
MWLNALVFDNKDYYAPAQQPLSFLSQSVRFFPVLLQQASPLEHLLVSAFLFLEQAVFSIDLPQDFSAFAHFLTHLDFSSDVHFCSVLISSLVVFVLCAKATFTNKPKVSNNNIFFIVLNS